MSCVGSRGRVELVSSWFGSGIGLLLSAEHMCGACVRSAVIDPDEEKLSVLSVCAEWRCGLGFNLCCNHMVQLDERFACEHEHL